MNGWMDTRGRDETCRSPVDGNVTVLNCIILGCEIDKVFSKRYDTTRHLITASSDPSIFKKLSLRYLFRVFYLQVPYSHR